MKGSQPNIFVLLVISSLIERYYFLRKLTLLFFLVYLAFDFMTELKQVNISEELLTMEKNIISLSSDTLKCLSTETLKAIKFPFVPNGKLIVFRYSNI